MNKSYFLLFIVCLVGNSNAQDVERTFAMIKPDSIQAKRIGAIISIIEENGFSIVRIQKLLLSPRQVTQLYFKERHQDYFPKLFKFLTSAPTIILVLERVNAIKAWRTLLENNIRHKFGTSRRINAVHGSDSPAAAEAELHLFFPDLK